MCFYIFHIHFDIFSITHSRLNLETLSKMLTHVFFVHYPNIFIFSFNKCNEDWCLSVAHSTSKFSNQRCSRPTFAKYFIQVQVQVQVLHTSRRCFGIHKCFYFSASLLDGIQIQNGIRHIEFEWPAFELNLNDAGFQVESIQETRIKILNIVLFIMFWIGVLWKEHKFRMASRILNLNACIYAKIRRCQYFH